jgi:transcriptional regulator with XRE-family HTH domain
LRREEVATLAGVGVTWYTWLEQGRDIQASAQVLEALARTLELDPHEHSHLLRLGGVADTEVGRDAQCLPPGVLAVLHRLDPYPGVVVNARLDILAYNRTYRGMIGDLDAVPFEQRNTLWLLLMHPAWRAAFPYREQAVNMMVAQLRAGMSKHLAEPAWKCLVSRLSAASPEFVQAWERHDVGSPENRTKSLISPRVGPLRLDFTNFWLGPNFETRLVSYTPADEASAAALDDLALLTAGDGQMPAASLPTERLPQCADTAPAGH